jgi:hypothetical protein
MRTLIAQLNEGVGTFGSALSDASQSFMRQVAAASQDAAKEVGATLKLEPSEIWWWVAIKRKGKEMGAMAVFPSQKDVHGACLLAFDPRDSGAKGWEKELDADSTVAAVSMHLNYHLRTMK